MHQGLVIEWRPVLDVLNLLVQHKDFAQLRVSEKTDSAERAVPARHEREPRQRNANSLEKVNDFPLSATYVHRRIILSYPWFWVGAVATREARKRALAAPEALSLKDVPFFRRI